MIKTYSPQIQVRLLKTTRRSKLTDGATAASRYQDFSGLDLTPFLAAGEPVMIRKQLSGAGNWGLTLVDRAIPGYEETLYAMIEPNDVIEIRMARAPHEYPDGNLPIVLRGFVSSVDRSRSNAGGNLHRRVHVAGGDYSKILDILRIYYLVNSVIGDNITTELGFFQKYVGEANAKIMGAAEFAQLVLDKVINPFMARLTLKAAGAGVSNQLKSEISIAGSVSPLSIALFADGSVRQFFSQFLDVGAFNEMFVEDRDDASVLVLRPNRFMDLNGNLIQGDASVAQDVADHTTVIFDHDVESITQGRSDAGVANYFWVSNYGWQIRETVEVSQLAAAGNVGQYALMDYVNADANRFGFRKMEVSSSLGPAGQNYGDALLPPASKVETDNLIDWLTERRRILAEQNKDNSVLEDGQMAVAGNEAVRVGNYVQVLFGSGGGMRAYVTGLTHTFIPNGAFRTSIAFERGDDFAARARSADPLYESERNLKGLL